MRLTANSLAFALLAILLVMVWVRTGLVPAASGGDEVWWSESGYWLAKEGVLKWEILDDDRGSGDRSFWPPLLPVVQAGFIRILGLNSFSVYAQSSLHCTLLVLLVYLLCRQGGVPNSSSILSAVGSLAVLSIQKSFVQVRMENGTALSVLAFLWLHEEGRRRRSPVYHGLAGFALGLGVLSYYPLSPFLLAGTFLYLLVEKDFRALGYTMLGGLPLALAAGVWVLPHWPDFYRQVVDTGANRYLSVTALPNYLLAQFGAGSVRGLPMAVELLLLIAVLGWKTVKGDERDRGYVILGWSLLAPIALISPPQLVGAFVCAWVLVFARPADSTLGGRVLDAARMFFAIAAVLQFLFMLMTAGWQFSGRNYAAVQAELDRIDLPEGRKVAISQRAWLGLRERAEPDQLHMLVYSGPSLLNASEAIKASDAKAEFDLLVLETDKIELLSELYPWVGRGIEEGTYKNVQRIRPEFRLLPWAASPNYDMTVFSKQSRDDKE